MALACLFVMAALLGGSLDSAELTRADGTRRWDVLEQTEPNKPLIKSEVTTYKDTKMLWFRMGWLLTSQVAEMKYDLSDSCGTCSWSPWSDTSRETSTNPSAVCILTSHFASFKVASPDERQQWRAAAKGSVLTSADFQSLAFEETNSAPDAFTDTPKHKCQGSKRSQITAWGTG